MPENLNLIGRIRIFDQSGVTNSFFIRLCTYNNGNICFTLAQGTLDYDYDVAKAEFSCYLVEQVVDKWQVEGNKK